MTRVEHRGIASRLGCGLASRLARLLSRGVGWGAVMWLQVAIPMWALVYMPILITISTLVFTDGGWHWALHYVLFENAMSVVKTAAMVSGLLELSNAHEWGERAHTLALRSISRLGLWL